MGGFKADRSSPRIQVDTLLLTTKGKICDVAERNQTTTSRVCADVLLAVEDNLAELHFIGRRKRAVVEQDLRLPEEATHADNKILERVMEEAEHGS